MTDRIRETLSRLEETLRRRTDWIERGKTVLIVMLCLSAVFLAGRTGLFGGARSFAELQEMLRGGNPDNGSSMTISAREYQDVARPQIVSISPEAGTRYATMYSTETEVLYERFATCLGEALGSAGMPEQVTQERWRNAIQGKGVYFDYLYEQSFLCLAAWQGTQAPAGVAGQTARRLFLSVEEDRVYLYFLSGNSGQAYRCSTALACNAVESRMASYQSNGAVFAFEEQTASALDPYAVILPGAAEVRCLSVSNPGVAQNVEEIMQMFGMNHITATHYQESDGGWVYLDGNNTLRLGSDGTIIFERGESQNESLTLWSGREQLPDVTEALYQAALKMAGDIGDCEIRLIRADYMAPNDRYELSFAYYADGMLICLPGGTAADFTVERGKITQAVIRTRSYQLTGETQTPLPAVQAAALVAASGGTEPIRVYQDSGDSVTAAWLGRRIF